MALVITGVEETRNIKYKVKLTLWGSPHIDKTPEEMTKAEMKQSNFL